MRISNIVNIADSKPLSAILSDTTATPAQLVSAMAKDGVLVFENSDVLLIAKDGKGKTYKVPVSFFVGLTSTAVEKLTKAMDPNAGARKQIAALFEEGLTKEQIIALLDAQESAKAATTPPADAPNEGEPTPNGNAV